MAFRNGKIWVSPSALNIFNDCQKCFWLAQVKNIHRPRGIFPSLPGGMDTLIKNYFDGYRAQGKMPPEVEGKIEAELFPDTNQLNLWRDWRTGLSYQNAEWKLTLGGALDDLGVVRQGDTLLYVPLDYKTRGYDVKEGGEVYYQNQLDCYALMLKHNGMEPIGYAYLIYYIPKELSANGMVRFDVVPKKVAVNPETALQTLERAVKVLHGPMPEKHSACEYCVWGSDFIEDGPARLGI